MYDLVFMDLLVGYEGCFRLDYVEFKNFVGFFDYDCYFDEQKMCEVKVVYYGLISFMDYCVGWVLMVLEQSG